MHSSISAVSNKRCRHWHPIDIGLHLFPANLKAGGGLAVRVRKHSVNSKLLTSVLSACHLVQLCRCDVQTVCFGLAASMGAFLLGAGTKGKRFSMPNARIMIHQPLGGASGQAVDIEIQAKEIMYHKANLNGIMSDYTGQPIDKVCCLGATFCTATRQFSLSEDDHAVTSTVAEALDLGNHPVAI